MRERRIKMARFNITGEPEQLNKAKDLLLTNGFHTTRIYAHNDGSKRYLAAYSDTKSLFFVSSSNGEPTYTLEEIEDKIKKGVDLWK